MIIITIIHLGRCCIDETWTFSFFPPEGKCVVLWQINALCVHQVASNCFCQLFGKEQVESREIFWGFLVETAAAARHCVRRAVKMSHSSSNIRGQLCWGLPWSFNKLREAVNLRSYVWDSLLHTMYFTLVSPNQIQKRHDLKNCFF